MNTMLKLEDAIMTYAQIESDLDVLAEAVMETELSTDQLANALIGLVQMQKLKFSRMFAIFEQATREFYSKNA